MNLFQKTLPCIFLLSVIIISQVFLANESLAFSNDKQTILITGANRGIGLALAEKFKNEGYNVIATTRKMEKAKALSKLGVQVEILDITNQQSVNTLRDKLKNQQIDILLNNAGVGGHSTREFKDLDIDRLGKIFAVNSLGALRMSQAFIPNLDKGSKKLIASISSRMGSITENGSGGAMGYRASKTALNSFNKSLSLEFA